MKPPRLLLAGAVLLGAPALQLAAEAATRFPVGPARMATLAVWLVAWVPLVRFGLARADGLPASRAARAGVFALVPLLGLAHVLAGARFSDGPFGPVPGGPLAGPVATEPHPDWSKARTARYAELEVLPDRPRSLETLVLARDGVLYVAANMPRSKRWPGQVLAEPRVRIRVGDRVYERSALRVEGAAHRAALLASMNEKYGFDVSLGGEIWFFALEPRRS